MPKGSEDLPELINRLATLQLEQQRIVEQIITQRTATPDKLQVGDRVRIINGKESKKATTADRTATVTKITKTRVCFTTDSGTKTWRIHSNVQRISDSHDHK